MYLKEFVPPGLGTSIWLFGFWCAGHGFSLSPTTAPSTSDSDQWPVTSDTYGDHAIVCAYSGERIGKHDKLRNVVFAAAQSALLSASIETHVDDSQSRPGDVYIAEWVRGKDAALDLTVVSPLQKALVNRCARESGAALEVAFKRKMDAHYARCRANNIVFLPLCVETLGGWHPDSASELRRIQRAVTLCSRQDQTTSEKHFFEKLAVSLQRSNSNMILSRQSFFPPSHVDFD